MSRLLHIYDNDESIIEGIINFNEESIDTLYLKHKNYCIRFMLKMYDDEETVKDIYQDAVLAFIENVRYKNLVLKETSIQTYLNSICRNQVLVRFKAAKRLTFAGQDEMESNFEYTFTDWLDDIHDLQSDRIAIIIEELNKMKEEGGKCYQLLYLFFFENRSMDYIAGKLGYTNADNVKNQKARCQKRLKEKVFNRAA
jgi:RNA polymerase sigma factor (sigma-70 family)